MDNSPFEVREMMLGKRDHFRYFHCRSCECIQIAEIPNDIARYYPADDYYSFWPTAIPDLLYNALIFQPYFDRRGIIFRILKHYLLVNQEAVSLAKLGPKKDWAVLDVGCGTGSLLRRMKILGFTNLLGVDPFIKSTIESPVTIRKTSLEQLHEEDFDLIMFLHSFEHMSDPAKALTEARDRLNDKGVILIRTPVVSRAFQRYRAFWYQLDAPRHLHIMSRKSIEYLASKSGLSLKRISYDSTEQQFMISEKYANNVSLQEWKDGPIRMLFGKLLSKQRYELITEAHYLNQMELGDQAAFCFRKAKEVG